MKIGSKIRSLRFQQRVTLRELAGKTGLSASFFSQLERDRLSPSISSLEKIAEALNTTVGYFFEREKIHGVFFIKKGSGKKFVVKEKKISVETLASGFLGIRMQPQVITLEIGAKLTKDLIYKPGEIFGMVLKGRLEFLCEKERLILGKGDSIYCSTYAQMPQKITNIGVMEAKLLWIIFMST